jgi:hypothetical protein
MKSLTSIQAAAMRDAGVRPLAKSLHTVSVLVNLSRYFMLEGETAEQAMATALLVLDLNDLPDVHGLKVQALKQLAKTTSKQGETA